MSSANDFKDKDLRDTYLIGLKKVIADLREQGVKEFTEVATALSKYRREWVAQQEGLRTLERIRSLMAQGEMPGEPLIDAFLILVAGFVLITPGILTDMLGFLMLIPATRAPIRRWIRGQLEQRFAAGNAAVYTIDPDER